MAAGRSATTSRCTPTATRRQIRMERSRATMCRRCWTESPGCTTARTKPSPQAHFYDDAMQKIKDALQSNETVALNDLDTISPISLNGTPSEEERPEFIDTPLDDDLISEFMAEDNNPVDAGADDDWEYVDEDGKPVDAGADDEWEYVDEDGNPVDAGADDEWEYVDEDGNPVAADANDDMKQNQAEQIIDDDIMSAFAETADK